VPLRVPPLGQEYPTDDVMSVTAAYQLSESWAQKATPHPKPDAPFPTCTSALYVFVRTTAIGLDDGAVPVERLLDKIVQSPVSSCHLIADVVISELSALVKSSVNADLIALPAESITPVIMG